MFPWWPGAQGGSNLRTGTNPPYAVADFLAYYTQFGVDGNNNPVVPQAVIAAIIAEANANLQQARWRTSWTRGMALYVAHYCQLYLETSQGTGTSQQAVLEAGKFEGIITNASAGDVSQGFDSNLAGRDSPTGAGWGDLHLTEYGVQLRTLAARLALGGIYVQ